LTSFDKAGVSRSLSSLADRELAESLQSSEVDERRRDWQLTRVGHLLHGPVLDIAIDRERRLIEGIDAYDLEIFLRVLRQMRRNVVTIPDSPELAESSEETVPVSAIFAGRKAFGPVYHCGTATASDDQATSETRRARHMH
jgi:hypothetical protein